MRIKDIPKTFIYAFVLIAVLVIGIWIGKNGADNSPIASIEGAIEDNIGSKNENNGSSESDIELSSINSTRSAKVERVLDGDTIEMESGERVRYLGINAPESGQPFSTEAIRENERLVAGRTVNLEFDIQTQDRYGRLLAYIWVGNMLVNKEIVKNGYAVSETIQPNVKYQDLILKAQEEARTACRGLWQGLCSQNTETSCIRIVNINADAPGNDNENKNGEWIEIKNTCPQAISMNDWLLKDNSASNKYKFGSFTLDGAKSIIIYSGCGTNTEDNLYWQCPEGKYAIWNNAGDHAFLYDDSAHLVTDYQY